MDAPQHRTSDHHATPETGPFRDMLEFAHAAIIIFDPNTERIIDVNGRATEVYGYTHDELTAATLDLIQPPARRGLPRTREILASRRAVEVEHRRKDGSPVVVEIRTTPLRYRGRDAILSFNLDVTDHKHTADRLEMTAEHLRAVSAEAPAFIYAYDFKDGHPRRAIYFGPGFDQIVGPRTAAESGRDFDHIWELIHPDDRAPLQQRSGLAVQNGQPFQADFRMRADDGERWVRYSGRHRKLHSGWVRNFGVLIDVTSTKHAERHQRLLIDELNHRVRNNLASVLNLFDLAITPDGLTPRAARELRRRVAALADVHTALAESRWYGITLDRLIRLAATPLAMHDRLAIRVQRNASAPPRTCQPLFLTIHELATNASKHGAWANHDGRVQVDAAILHDHLAITWTEHDGPPPVVPPTPGQGTAFMKGFVEFELAGRLTLDYKPTGLHAIITAPLTPDDRQPPAGC